MKETKVTLKKIVLSIFMCLALALGIMPVEEVKATGADPTKAPAINFDTTQKGSINIHKYEYNPGDPAPTPIKGTGEAGQNIPDGATALENVGFTIYKIADADELKAYYGISSTTTYDSINYYDTVNGKYQIKSNYNNFPSQTATTNTNGLATFTGLDLGIYLVIETGVPDKVTAPVVPFLVSVPMTTSSGDDWLYDVHVYPKNKTTYGGVKLKKMDDSGNELSGVQFVLQKKQANGTYTTVVKNDKNEDIGIDGVLSTTAGVIEVTNLSPGEYRFIETGIGDNHGCILDGVTAYTFKINDDSSIDYGTTATVDDAASPPNTYIKVVNEKPDVTKQVMNSSGTPVRETDYSVGDTISYKITVKVPSNIAQLRTFEVKDTPTNIAYKKGTLKVYNSDKAKTLTKDTHYTIDDTTNAGAFTVSFITTADNGIKDAGGTIIIEYDAVLQNGAVDTAGGNSNTVNLKYEDKILPEDGTDGNPNPTKTPDSTPNSTYEIEDSATVYTFKVNIEKTGESSAPLAGVKFELYKEDTNGTVTGDVAKALGLTSTTKWKKIETLTTASNGTVSTQGLANGTYYIVETETNDGYNLLAKPVKVELNATYATKFNGIQKGATKTVKNGIDAGTSTLTPSMSIDDGTAQSNFTVQIKNSKGFILPTTGGAGSFLFTLIGCMIMIVGFILFRKTKAKKADAV